MRQGCVRRSGEADSDMSIPVAFFVYDRPGQTAQVLAAMRKQTARPETILVFADGPRDDAAQRNVAAVRATIRSVDWAEVRLFERERNLGSAANILQGLDEVFQSYDRAVILEDDTLPAAHFYESMRVLLDHYAGEAAVFSVGGYPSIKPDSLSGYPYDIVLSPRFTCWGWATWSDRWRDMARRLRESESPFTRPEDVPAYAGSDLAQAVRLILERPRSYWDLPIALHCLLQGMLHALTRHYLVNNIGVTTGVHGHAGPAQIDYFRRQNGITEKVPGAFPPPVRRDDVCAAIADYLGGVWQAVRDDTGSIPLPKAQGVPK